MTSFKNESLPEWVGMSGTRENTRLRKLVIALAAILYASSFARAAPPDKVAVAVDVLLAKESPDGTSSAGKLPRRADDETFLRRVSLDLIGELPSPEAITAFGLDSDP